MFTQFSMKKPVFIRLLFLYVLKNFPQEILSPEGDFIIL